MKKHLLIYLLLTYSISVYMQSSELWVINMQKQKEFQIFRNNFETYF